MKRRHPRSAALTALALLLSSTIPFIGTTTAASAASVAGTGYARTNGTALNMRAAPASTAARVGSVPNGGKVWIVCQVLGEFVTGTIRQNRVWNRLANNTYVSDAYIYRTVRIPVCGQGDPLPPTANGWMLPVSAGLVSGYRTAARPAHDGVDLGARRFTPIRAAAAGRVIRVVCNVSAGSCDVDGNRLLTGCGWYAEIQHAGGIVTRYCHMVRRPSVVIGQTVAKGQVIGYVGSSGSSSGPHLHFEVHIQAPPATRANAVNPVLFMMMRGLRIR